MTRVISDLPGGLPVQRQKAWIRAMFGAIADRYDLINTILSAGAHARWKRAAAREATVAGPAVAVDLCCGTGDVLLQLAGRAALVVGVDFTPAMLAVAARRMARAGRGSTLLCADAEALPLADDIAGAVTIAFGLRNLADPRDGLREMYRILRPGGRLVALETALPPHPLLRICYEGYARVVMAGFGGWVSGRRAAYRYLTDSIHHWPDPNAVSALLGSIGFESVGYRTLAGGVAVLHTAIKPPDS